jgi:hypothetical protein
MKHVDFVFRPIERWPQEPTPPHRRRNAQFKVTYERTLQDLEYELARLGVTRAFIQADVSERDIRADGLLRSDSRPQTPRVIVSATSKHGPLSLPCDTYSHWKDNLRAIALSLEALRDVDRHGVTKRGEQYRGLKQLTDGSGPINSEEAAQFISATTGGTWPKSIILGDSDIFESAYRLASKKLHPDVAGAGAAEQWNLQKAAAILRHHFDRARA